MTDTSLSLRSPAPRSPAVTGLAWGFILFALATLLLVLLSRAPGDALATTLGVDAGSGGLTGGVAWMIERSTRVANLLLLGALVTLGLAVALLRRLPWARRAFIALMAAGFVGVLGGAALTPLTFSLLPDAATTEAINVEDPVAGLIGLLGGLILFATLLTALFAWAGWKLTTPAVRAEFEHVPVPAEG
jgi:preprotein translocase subunit SecG